MATAMSFDGLPARSLVVLYTAISLQLVAACTENNDALSVEKFEPAQIQFGRTMLAEVIGRNFFNRVRRSLDEDTAELYNAWEVTLGGQAVPARRLTLGRIAVEVPELPVGSYDIGVRSPWGDTAALNDALTVVDALSTGMGGAGGAGGGAAASTGGSGGTGGTGGVAGAGGGTLGCAIDITARRGFTCAALTNGTAWCFGNNQTGQLGDGSTQSSSTPVRVLNLTGITRVAAASRMAYAVDAFGTMWAWGLNDFGQLGDGTTTDRLVPIAVPGLSGVAEIAAGRGHVCARTVSAPG